METPSIYEKMEVDELLALYVSFEHVQQDHMDEFSKEEIYKLITELAKEGKAVLMISSEMEELIGVCDRIYVMAKGRISGELARKDFSQENIMKLALRG